MNKKILGIVVVLMAVAMLAPPVMATPTQGRKTAVILRFIWPHNEVIDLDTWYSGPVYHRLWASIGWNVELEIVGGPILEGTCDALRKTVQVMPKGKDLGKANLVDHYEFYFPAQNGGFEGNGKVMLRGYDPVAGTNEGVLINGFLFHGTGAFEGQTLNLRHLWEDVAITGYWLNCDL